MQCGHGLCYKKSGGYIHTQTALDFKLNLDEVTRKGTFQEKSLLHSKKAMTSTPPKCS